MLIRSTHTGASTSSLARGSGKAANHRSSSCVLSYRLRSRGAYTRLEPDDGKPSSPVLRGGSGSDAASLPDRNAHPKNKASLLRSAQSKETGPPEGLRPWRAQEAPQSSALRLCRPACGRPPLRSGWEPHLLHLPPLLAWARAKACLLANTARPFKNGGTTQ